MTKELTKDIIQWDVKSWSKALSYWDSKVEWNKIQHSLELGGREGGLSLWLALKGKSVVCSDLKDVQKTAEQLHKRHHVSTWITYQDIDATNIPYEEYFDLIVFKSIIGGIGRNDNYKNQHKVFKEIYKALKPGGKLLFAENLAASAVHRRLRKRFVQWGSSWRYVSLDEMKEFLSDFSYYDIKTTGLLGTFGRTERQRNVLSAVDDLVLNKICPDRWKYICYGIAEK
ncbi:MAG: SAM-dependent methyltransferase [Bacteroidota bacterium]|jgi:SAM-dependent methyltransferase